jgi:adenosylcobinamide-GDP ribazoletransferase
MKYELRIFFTALMFYTRIPCPGWVGHEEDYLNQATRYFPLIGWVVGAIAGGTYWLSSLLFGPEVGLVLSLVASILSTGAFHEDGFADVCDGFGGGWTKEKILLIMKDSRLGTYGVIGIGLMLALKFTALYQLFGLQVLHAFEVLLLFISVHAVSRFTATTFMYTHAYVRDTDDSKAKPIAKQLSRRNLTVAFLFALLPLLALSWLAANPFVMAVLLPAYAAKMYLSRYFTKWVGGYTGDCLGATQQVAEVVLYLSFLLVWKFT